ncbi:MAG: isoprenoid biosynthesis glyoxalase ElbB, partial [Deltaproteobacteria bacterium]|nr:isoprenoid biosynthesis glyoxalase ElbB [Deltaproteobacteria bacterium]
MAKVGIILSGCGVYDGSEIHETVITLLALDRAGAEVVMMAPDMEQAVVNHLTGETVEGLSRNVLEESARIARGNISDIANIKASDMDALFIPGGFGAAKNLCDFAFKGPDCDVHPEVARLIREILAAKKPLAAVCIAPALVAKVLGD